MRRVTDIDLSALAATIRHRLSATTLGYLPRKTEIRDLVVQELDCPMTLAERVVETMEHRELLSDLLPSSALRT